MKSVKRMMQLMKIVIFSLLLFTVLTACSISTDQEVNPKTLDFTGQGQIGEDTSFDITNRVEINSDHTGDHRDDQRMEIASTETTQSPLTSQTIVAIDEVTADQVALLDDVNRAIILETDNNAFVAVKLRPGMDTITDELRTKITQIVIANVDHADNVHIANNPDFYQQMQSFALSVKSNRPTGEYIREFSSTIRRIFPDAR